MNWLRAFLTSSTVLLAADALAADFKIVSWNIAAEPFETVQTREADYRKMADTLQPDVIVLIELTGRADLKVIADAIGWPTYYASVSDGQAQGAEIHMGLEVGVLSKIPITSVTELDAKLDGRTHAVFTNAKPDGDSSILVSEKLLKGIEMMGVAPTDRGTPRVNLANGLTVFPVLKPTSRAYWPQTPVKSEDPSLPG